MNSQVTCPYCNAVVAATEAKTICPRCGEAFETANAEVVEGIANSRTVAAPPAGFLQSRAAILASIVVAIAIIGIGLAVLRPWSDAPKPTNVPVEARPTGTAPPLALVGLTYLPETVNIAFAVQPGPLVAYAERTGMPPKEWLAKSGIPATILALLDKIGIPFEQIDHLVGGVSIGAQSGDVLPGLTIVLRLRKPIADEDRFLKQLGADKPRPKAGRTTYAVNVGAPLLMTKLDPLGYLFGLKDEDLSATDKPFAEGGGQLPKELREAITNRLSPASFVWLATDSDRWGDKPLAKLPGTLDPKKWKDLPMKLNRGRAIVAGLSLEPEPMLRLAVRLADIKDAENLRAPFQNAFPAAGTTIETNSDWTTLATPFDPKTTPDSWKRLMPELPFAK